MSTDDLMTKNTDFLCTETSIKSATPAGRLLLLLQARSTTGRLTFDLIKGGVRQITLSEKTPATESQREEIRRILDME